MRKRAHEVEWERNLEREYLVKAAMLVKIHQQTIWPAKRSSIWNRLRLTRKKRVTICVIGKNPFPPQALDLFKQASVGHWKYKLRVSDTLPRRNCEIVFIAEDKNNEVDELLRQLGSKPTLTVSDIPGFANKGGNIELFLFAGRVIKLLINEPAAAEKGFCYGAEMHNPKLARFVQNLRQVDNEASDKTKPSIEPGFQDRKILFLREGLQTLH